MSEPAIDSRGRATAVSFLATFSDDVDDNVHRAACAVSAVEEVHAVSVAQYAVTASGIARVRIGVRLRTQRHLRPLMALVLSALKAAGLRDAVNVEMPINADAVAALAISYREFDYEEASQLSGVYQDGRGLLPPPHISSLWRDADPPAADVLDDEDLRWLRKGRWQGYVTGLNISAKPHTFVANPMDLTRRLSAVVSTIPGIRAAVTVYGSGVKPQARTERDIVDAGRAAGLPEYKIGERVRASAINRERWHSHPFQFYLYAETDTRPCAPGDEGGESSFLALISGAVSSLLREAFPKVVRGNAWTVYPVRNGRNDWTAPWPAGGDCSVPASCMTSPYHHDNARLQPLYDHAVAIKALSEAGDSLAPTSVLLYLARDWRSMAAALQGVRSRMNEIVQHAIVHSGTARSAEFTADRVTLTSRETDLKPRFRALRAEEASVTDEELADALEQMDLAEKNRLAGHAEYLRAGVRCHVANMRREADADDASSAERIAGVREMIADLQRDAQTVKEAWREKRAKRLGDITQECAVIEDQLRRLGLMVAI